MARSRRFVFPDRTTTVADALPVIREALRDEGLELAPAYSHGKVTSALVDASPSHPAGVEFQVPAERIVDPDVAMVLRIAAAEYYERVRQEREARIAAQGGAE